ncbi:MAG: UDP-N-acetylmuramoyl-L-alanine--D-glutamate ligase [Bacteroidota bacterium]
MAKIGILGGGESGVGAALLAQKLGEEVFLSDARILADRFKSVLQTNHIPFEEGGHTEETFFEADIIVKSPGIPDTVPFLQRLHAAGKEVISEIEYAGRYATAPIVAITGSNGKTTTTALIGHLLKHAGRKVEIGGNIGDSLARLVASQSPEVFVVEVSSFQLDQVNSFQPAVALLLNITPDHLDRYEGSMDLYGAAKFRIGAFQGEPDVFIYNQEDPETLRQMSQHELAAQRLVFGLEKQEGTDAWVEAGHLCLKGGWSFPFEQMQLLGKHNQLNALAALLAVEAMGVEPGEVEEGLRTFAPIPHRLEPVGEIEGVRYLNDSKATNVDAVAYALEAMDRPVVWIAGGVDKGNDYQQIETLVQKRVRALGILGPNDQALRQQFDLPTFQAHTMNEILEWAKKEAKAGEVVLLSPACASFDLFKNYEDRGNQFRLGVQQLKSTL